jgi:hypothetical protein
VRSARGRHVHARDLCALPDGNVRAAERRLRRSDDGLLPVPPGADLRRRGRLGSMRSTSHVPTATLSAQRHVRPRGRRMRRRHRELRNVHAASDVRRRWHSRPVRPRALHADDVCPAGHRLRPGRRRLRQPPELRNMCAASDVRRWRQAWAVRRLGRPLVISGGTTRAARRSRCHRPHPAHGGREPAVGSRAHSRLGGLPRLPRCGMTSADHERSQYREFSLDRRARQPFRSRSSSTRQAGSCSGIESLEADRIWRCSPRSNPSRPYPRKPTSVARRWRAHTRGRWGLRR